MADPVANDSSSSDFTPTWLSWQSVGLVKRMSREAADAEARFLGGLLQSEAKNGLKMNPVLTNPGERLETVLDGAPHGLLVPRDLWAAHSVRKCDREERWQIIMDVL